MKHIPNILSATRIVLIPFFVWQFAAGHNVAAGIILLVSSITDLFDGFLARHFNWISDLGKLLDPIADKLTQASVSIMLIIKLNEYWYFFAFMLFKDFVILALGGYLLKQGMHFKGAKFLGKVSTFIFYGGMILIVLFPTMPNWLTLSILILASSLALISALLYIPEYFKYKQEIAAEHSAADTTAAE